MERRSWGREIPYGLAQIISVPISSTKECHILCSKSFKNYIMYVQCHSKRYIAFVIPHRYILWPIVLKVTLCPRYNYTNKTHYFDNDQFQCVWYVVELIMVSVSVTMVVILCLVKLIHFVHPILCNHSVLWTISKHTLNDKCQATPHIYFILLPSIHYQNFILIQQF